MPELSASWSGRLRSAAGRTEAALAAVLALLVALFGALAPGFLSAGNAVNLIEGCSVTAIMAIGLLVVLVAGGIDISFAASASVAQYLAGYLAARAHWTMPLVIVANLFAGALLGALNALLIERLRASSIIITIATMSLYFALLMYCTGGRSIYDLPAWWIDPVVLWQSAGAGPGTVRVTLPILVLALVALLTAWLLGRTALGQQIHAVGGNPQAARRVGVRLLAVNLFAYGYLGLLAALAGLVQAHRVGEAVPNALVGGELFVLASAVLGGASLSGGSGTVTGVLLGIALLAVLRNGLNLMAVSPYFFQVLLGLVLLAAAALGGRGQRRAQAAIA